jgi:hypothetical protein
MIDTFYTSITPHERAQFGHSWELPEKEEEEQVQVQEEQGKWQTSLLRRPIARKDDSM